MKLEKHGLRQCMKAKRTKFSGGKRNPMCPTAAEKDGDMQMSSVCGSVEAPGDLECTWPYRGSVSLTQLVPFHSWGTVR